MGKRMTTDDQLAVLRKLRAGEPSPAGVEELGGVLKASKLHGLALKGAAELLEKWEARGLAAALAAAAESLAPEVLGTEAGKRDPGAEGKQAALRVLVGWEAELPEFYLKASRWVQKAAVMNGSVDVSAECRGLAGVGIAQTRAGGAEAAIAALIDLLVDEEVATRVRAAQALGIWRGPEAVPLLRLKALTGDEQAEVLGEVFASLIRHDGREYVGFVGRFLMDEEDRIVEAAALALGESRQAAALGGLAAAYQRMSGRPVRTSILMAIALLRQEESLAWLLDRLERGRAAEGLDLLDALRIYRGDEKAAGRIREAAERKGGEVRRVWGEMFG
jgi:hypothetical protein